MSFKHPQLFSFTITTFLLAWMIVLSGFQQARGQNQYVIEGQVLDIVTKLPVKDAHVLLVDSKLGTTTDSAGQFILLTEIHEVSLVVSHIAYQTNNVSFDLKNTGQILTIYLTPKSFELSETVITAKRQFKYSVIDYEFIGTNVLVLAMNHRYNSLVLFLLDENLDTISKQTELPGKSQGMFFKDCFDHCHLLFKDVAYQLFFDGDILHLTHKVAVEQLYQSLENCLFETENHLVFKRVTQNEYMHSYFAVNKETSEMLEFISDFDQEKMRKLEDELRFINRNPGAFRSVVSRGLAIEYAKKIAFKPSDKFLCKIGDSIYYFNHGESRIEVYSADFNLQTEIRIGYHQQKKWDSRIIIDRISKKAYTISTIGSKFVIDEINLNDGSTIPRQIIPLAYPQNLKINNGFVYFLYRDIGNIWAKKELFRLKL